MLIETAPSTSARAHTRYRRHRLFFRAMSILLLIVVFAGFAPTYYLRPATAATIPFYLHVHGAAMTAWFLLLLLQTVLIAARRRSVHRRFGLVGTLVAVIIVLLNPLVVARSIPNGIRNGAPVPILTLIAVGDLLLMAVFAVLVTLAVLWRNRPEAHSRLLLLGSIAVASPAMGRFSIGVTGTPILGLMLQMVLPLGVVAHDVAMTRHVHPASAWGAAAIIGALVFAIAISNSPLAPVIVSWF